MSGWKLPEQNLTRASLTAEISDDGSLDRVLFSMSYVQLVGPALIFEGAFLIADMKALSLGIYVFLGVPDGMAV